MSGVLRSSGLITRSVVQTELAKLQSQGRKWLSSQSVLCTHARLQLAMVSSYLVVVKGHLSLAPDGPEFCLDPTVGSVDSSPRRVRIL